MNLECYPYFTSNNFQDYEFYSYGPKGRIKKVVRFTKVFEDSVIYNLAFGDLDEGADKFDDKVESNNQDRDIVLATIASTVIDFTNHYGDNYIYAEGSTTARTRLYQMSIAKLLDDISIIFVVYGLKDDVWHRFEKNVNYDAFLLKRK